jgi:hypothetical protein
VTTGNLDRRTVLMLGLGVAAILVLRFGVYGGGDAQVVAPADSVAAAEKRLERLRRIASMVPGKEIELKRAKEQLGVREKGLIAADTAAQAQAQLLEIVRRTAQKEGIDARGAEELKVKPLAGDYGEVSVTVSFSCAIEQFVNFMAALANEPQLLATNEIHIASANAKQKTVQVRLALSGVVPKKLVPEKKGVAIF